MKTHIVSPYVLTKATALSLIHKKEIFQEVTKTRKHIFLAMITPLGIERNAYSSELINHQVTLSDLFVPRDII